MYLCVCVCEGGSVCIDREREEERYSQLHDQVQMVGTLVYVVQSHDVLMLNPAKKHSKEA